MLRPVFTERDPHAANYYRDKAMRRRYPHGQILSEQDENSRSLIIFQLDDENFWGIPGVNLYKVLTKALNASTKTAREALAKRAGDVYTVKRSILKKSMSMKKARGHDLSAAVIVQGGVQEMRAFKTTSPRAGVKAKIRQDSSLKLIQSKLGNHARAFVATFSSGHTAIVQRQVGETYTQPSYIARRKRLYGDNVDMTRIKKLLSISAPKMVGDERRVFGELRPVIYESVLSNIGKYLGQELEALR